MRQRLILAFVGLAVIVVCLYAVPRAFVVSDLIRSQERHRVDDTARVLARLIEANPAHVSEAFLTSVKGDHEWIQVRRGTTVIGTAGAGLGAARDDLVATRPLAQGGSVTVGLSARTVSAAIRDALLPLAALGIGIVGIAGILGYLLALGFARPFQELADAAEGLGLGDLDPHLPRYRMRELRAIATGLTSSGARIGAMLEHERKLFVHASHELRTPIAALRLTLEDVALWPETPESVRTQLHRATGELDRLTAAVGDLLELSHQRQAQSERDVDLPTLIAEVVAQDGLVDRVVLRKGRPVALRVEAAATTTVIRALTQDLLTHGATQVVITVRRRRGRAEISFQPRGDVAFQVVPAETAEVIAAVGGRVAAEGRGLVLRLPVHENSRPHAAD